MQKLVIKSQFMGVKPCEIELKKFLLLIGEQASGKSTIAKLIYFFQTLPDAVYENAVLAYGRGEAWHHFGKEIKILALEKFKENFGTIIQPNGFEIVFHYHEPSQTYLEILEVADKLIKVKFHSSISYNLEQLINSHFTRTSPLPSTREDEIRFREHLRGIINDAFKRQNNNHTFLIAGRNTFVALPEIFEKTVSKEIEKLIEDEVTQQDFQKRQHLGNERLMLQFVEWSKGVKEYFKRNGQLFNNVIRHLENKEQLEELSNISQYILKGVYNSDINGENIYLENEKISSVRLMYGVFWDSIK
jgi:predicted ATPase